MVSGAPNVWKAVNKGDALFNQSYDWVKRKTVVKIISIGLFGFTWTTYYLSTVDGDLAELKQEVPKIEEKVDTMIGEVKEVKSSVNVLQEDHVNLKRALATVDTDVDGLKKVMPKIEKKVDTVISEVQEVKNSVKEVKKVMPKIEKKVDTVMSEVQEVKNSVKVLYDDRLKLKGGFAQITSHMRSPVPPEFAALRSKMRQDELFMDAWKKRMML